MKTKIRLKKVFFLFLTILLVLTTVWIPIKGANVKITVSHETGYSYNVTDKNGLSTFGASMGVIKADNEEAFCVQPGLLVQEGLEYYVNNFSWIERQKLEQIAYVGWYKSSKSDSDYVATQFMIWEKLGATINSTDFSEYPSYKKNIKNKMDTFFYTNPSFKDTIKTLKIGESVSLTDTNSVISNYHVTSSDGLKVEIHENSVKITATETAKESSVIYFDLVKKEQQGISMLYSSENSQDVAVFRQSDPHTISMKVNVLKTGSLKIAKQDEDGKYVPGTSFKLSYQSNMSDAIGTYTTGADGTITIDKLDASTVYIQEVAVPNHLVLDGAVHSVVIKPNETVSYKATNDWIKGKVQLKKTDSKDGKQIAGATYAIFDKQNKELQRLVTTSTGYVTSGYLRFGDYYVKEVLAPTGYVLNDSKYPVAIINDNQVVTVNGSDKPIEGYIQVIKKDVDTSKTVKKANTTFAVYQTSNDSLVATIKTNENGIAKTDLLRYGDYYLVEKTAPSGYTISNQKVKYKITEDGHTYSADLSNKRVYAKLSLSKEDSVTGKIPQGEATLKGAVYELKARNIVLDPADGSQKYAKDTVVATLTTDIEGNASKTDLYLGDYYLKERTPSHGYTLDPTEYEVKLAYKDQNTAIITKTQTVKERVKAQPFSIIKISNNGSGETDLLSDVEFTVKAQKDIELAGSWDEAPIAKNALGKTTNVLVTDGKGYAKSEELPFGSYVVRETKIPDQHYKVPDFAVNINNDSREPQPWRVFNDEKFKAAIRMIKIDQHTGNIIKVAGAKFKIKDVKKDTYVGSWVWNPLPHYVDTWETTENGMVMTDDLLSPGEYQLEEVEAPKGYLLNEEPMKFKVATDVVYETLPDGTTPVISVEMSDMPVKGQIKIVKEGELLVSANVSKQGVKFIYEKRKLPGAVFDIYANEIILSPDKQEIVYAKDELVETIISNNEGLAISKELDLGSYYVKESKAPTGFVTNPKHVITELSYGDQVTPIVFTTTSVYDERQHLAIQTIKEDAITHEMIAGAEISLKANQDIYNYAGELLVKKGTVLEKVVSKKQAVTQFKTDLPLDPQIVLKQYEQIKEDGNHDSYYLVEETAAPKGYTSHAEKYYLNARYQQDQQSVLKFTYTFKNEKTRILITKVAKDSNKLLADARLVLKDEKGNMIAQWKSEHKAHVIEGLEIGKQYRLMEQKAAAGYASAKDILFTVKDLPEQTVVMMDEPLKVEIDKKGQNDHFLKGNTLALYDHSNKLIDRWISGEKGHLINGLIAHETYRLVEEKAVDGYSKAKDVTFEVKDTSDLQIITMKNSRIPIKPSPVQSGDTTYRMLYITAVLLSVVGMYCLLSKKGKKGKE